MTQRFLQCGSCGNTGYRSICDGCGVDVRGMEDAVNIAVYLPGRPTPTQLDYCRPCAVKNLPAAVGVGPGSDLPASTDAPKEAAAP